MANPTMSSSCRATPNRFCPTNVKSCCGTATHTNPDPHTMRSGQFPNNHPMCFADRESTWGGLRSDGGLWVEAPDHLTMQARPLPLRAHTPPCPPARLHGAHVSAQPCEPLVLWLGAAFGEPPRYAESPSRGGLLTVDRCLMDVTDVTGVEITMADDGTHPNQTPRPTGWRRWSPCHGVRG